MGTTYQLGAGTATLPERIGNFRIRGVLGQGGMGVVFDAIAPDGRPSALKVIRATGDGEKTALLTARFLREAKILEQLDHEGIVRLVGSGDVEGLLYLAMEKIEGVSLLSIRRRGALSFEVLTLLGVRLASALAHMHDAGVVHRDIKPANILIDSNGHPIITDFGISGFEAATGITRHGDLLGSPGFMAPEIVEGRHPTPLSDQFSLGRLLYELGALGPAKRLPKNAPILEVLAASLEINWDRFPVGEEWDALRPVLQQMVAKKPKERFVSSAVAQATLESLLPEDVLGSETLQEELGSLDLPRRTMWEALAADLDAPDHGDELIANLDRPAGDRDVVVESRDPAPPPDPADSGTDENDPALESTADESLSAPHVAVALPVFPRFGDSESFNPADDDEQEEPTQLAIPLSEVAGGTLPPAPIFRARPISNLYENSQGSPPGIESQIPILERQVSRLTAELERAKRAKAVKKSNNGLIVALILAAAMVGFGIGYLARPVAPDVVELTLVAPYGPGGKATIMYGYDVEASGSEIKEARGMLEHAYTLLTRRDFDAAEGLLGECIRLADLADCHRTLGSVYAMTGDKRARAHLERYLKLAPNAEDAPSIRAALQQP